MGFSMKNIYIKYFLSVLFIVLLCTKNYAQQPKLIKRVMTDTEFTNYKNFVGTYEKGKNYNQIIDGHGTGLMPPTEEQWKEMKNQPLLIDKIDFPLETLETPASHDNSSTIWFPPIGHQDGEGSCVSWSCVYYTKTFQEAREHNWDLSGCVWEGGPLGYPSNLYQDKIFTPDFVYHQVNNGVDNGSSYSDNINLLQQIGCCTWDKMPNDGMDHTSWPKEIAWSQAPLYRSQTGYTAMMVNTDSGIENLKQLLVNGNLAVISINADYYTEFTSGDLWTLDNYNTTSHNHANTIVGYDDNFGPYTELGNLNTYGAFKVANSWGVGSWENVTDGFYYISYACMKQSIRSIYLYQNSEDYEPKMVAVFEMNHDFRSENKIDFGVLDSQSSQVLKPLNNFSSKGGNFPYPANPIVIDISELMPYMSEPSNQFFMKVNDGGSSTTGTIQYFAVEKYDDYSSGIPKNVFVSTETPLNTQQGSNVWVNLLTSSETIAITYPTGGEEFDIGSNPTITYTSVGTSGYINLDYSTDRGTTWNSIATNVLDNGEFTNWIVPNTPSADCKIRISDLDGTPSIISKGLFRIGPYEFTEQSSISLISAGLSFWGDYDNDGNLDILLICSANEGNISKIYRNNGNSTFTEQSYILLPGAAWGSAAWGDYDNDGDLDILLTGTTENGRISKIYRNEGNNVFEEQTTIALTSVSNSSTAWGDYDNDGDLDILMTGLTESGTPTVGTFVSKIYRNNGNNTFTEQTSISLIDVTDGSVAWGDYDNDGDLDILLTGVSDIGRVSKIYRNNGNNTFTEQTSISLTGGGRVAWGDYDNDGDLDILLTGAASGPTSKIYRNDGNNTFSEQTSIHLFSLWGGSASWGDYDNDGNLDMLLTGSGPSVNNSRIYHNNGNNAFAEKTSITLDNASIASWGDYDNDGDLDILLNGSYSGIHSTKIYRNNIAIPNTPPSAPSNLNATGNGNDVTFSWDKSTDAETPQNGLTYNLVIGTSPGACDILSPMSDINTGKRRIISMGNTGHNNSWTIKDLPDGQYYWSVQAIDNSFSGSNFAPVQSLTFQSSGSITITYPTGGEVFAVGSNPIITYSSLDNSGYINLDYSTDGGSTWDTITTNTEDDGEYTSWIVPNTPSTNCKIKVSDSDGNPTVISTGLFTIMDTVSYLSQGLVAYYPFDGNTNDGSGNEHNGSSYGGISWVNDRFDRPMSAISFNGIDGRIEVPHNDKFNYSDDTLSLSMWFNIAQHVAYGGLVCKGNNVSNYCVSDRLDMKLAININHYSSTSEEILTTTAFLTNEWHHLVVIYTPTQINLYVDGQFSNQITLSKVPLINTEPLYFGVDADGGWEYLKGKLDDIRIYNRVLTEFEIISLYNESPATPIITLQPVSQTVTEGETLTFTVEATCDGPLGFQWWSTGSNQWNDGDKNGRLTIVSTSNSSTLTITNANIAEDNDNNFLCEVKNLDGYPADGYWVNSNEVNLTVQPLDQFTELASISLPAVYFGSWGDYDNDGDLDILLNYPVSKIFRNNGNNTFEEQSISLLDIANGSWGDYDNDGDLDILLTGYMGSELASKIYRNNGDNTFEEQSISLVGVGGSTSAWGDYDNDGNLDILMIGNSASGAISKIYRNNGNNTFEEQTTISLIGVRSRSAAWGDYDNDGDLDILLAGESKNGPISKIYRNNGDNTFTDQVSLIEVSNCSAVWGDYDNDGYLDILITGNSVSGPISKIYRNNKNGTFEEQPISLPGISGSSAAWGDYDNDGNLDIVLTGNLEDVPVSKIFRNNGNNTFEEQTFDNLTGVSGQVAWGDYDNDGDLDLLLTGYDGNGPITKIYRNNNITSNNPPTAPSNLQALINGNDVTFSWNKSTDNETPQNGLHYNLVIGTTPNGVNTLSPMSDRETGFRKVVRLGNSQTNNWTIKDLPDGQYYWSVQAIDNAFAGSNFAVEKSFAMLETFVNLKVYLEGAYNSGSMSTSLNTLGNLPLKQPYNYSPFSYNGGEEVTCIPEGTVDWVLVELRSGTSADTRVSRRAAFLKSDGSIVDLDGASALKLYIITAGNYYVVVYHRNHLAVMSNSAIPLTTN